MQQIQDVSTQFLDWFQADPEFTVCLSLFSAKRWLALSVGSRSDQRVHIYSMDHNEYLEFSLDDLEPEGEGWVEFFQTTCLHAIGEKSVSKGFNAVLGGTIPLMACVEFNLGLQILTARSMAELSSLPWTPEEVKVFCIENRGSEKDEEGSNFDEILDLALEQVHMIDKVS